MAAEKAQLRFLKQRAKRQKLEKAPLQSSVVSLQVIGNGSLDSPPSILVITDTTRYVFNCGEGTQRLMMECGSRNISRLEHLFFTRMSWENVGGAIGMTITLKNVGLPKVSMYGPPNLKEFVQALQIFAKHETIDIDVKPYTVGPIKNETMVVTPVALFPTSSAKSSDGSIASPSPEEDLKLTSAQTGLTHEVDRNTRESRDMSSDDGCPMSTDASGTKRKAPNPFDVIAGMNVKPQSPETSPKRKKTDSQCDFSIAYVCKLHKKVGKLLVEKAKELGLKPSPHFEMVKSGQAVTLPDGRVVQPEEVLGPSNPGPAFIVLECPNQGYIDAVVSNEVFPKYFADCGEDTAAIVFHMCPEEVLHDARYQEWIGRFGPSTEHVILNQSCSSLCFDASRGQQIVLNQLHSDIFPVLPTYSLKPAPVPPTIKIAGGYELAKLKYAEIYNKYHLKPHKGWDREFIVSEDKQRFLDELEPLTDFQESLKALHTSLKEHSQCDTVTSAGKYPEVVFLGTGSAMPNKARNVSGILLNLSESRSMIMDCGEGTFGQLSRHYGDKVDDIIANIQCIFISHIHADHHAGLINLLRHWRKVTHDYDPSHNLILIGPKRMFIWLNNFDSYCEPFIHKLRFIELRDLNVNTTGEERSRHEQSLLSRLNLKEFNTVYVRHCPNAHGAAFTHQDGWKMVYSGDTMPCDNLIKAGKGADLLIHEATLEDGMEAEAKKKRHSMISEAIQVGQSMEAKFLILTHFSQRYPKVPLIDTKSSSKVGIAFDNMRVSMSELEMLPVFLPTLRHLFADAIQELEEIRDKKAEKKTISNKASESKTQQS